MADLIRRGTPSAVRRGDPLSQLREMQRDLDRMFSQVFGGDIATVAAPVTAAVAGDWIPSVDTYMKGDNIVLKCELPGVDPEDLEVFFDQSANQLVVSGERKQDAGTEDYIYQELPYGRFERRFAIPAGVDIDQMKAKFINGILEIIVPKATAAKPKKIQIEAAKLAEAGAGKKAA